MNHEPIVKVEHVSKKFCRYLRTSMRYGVQDIAKSLLRLSTKPDKLRPNEFWAVNDISFELNKGECLGIIGPNGSGKSTLLKMLNGIYMPDTGRIEINGRIGALIELGAGFHPMLTGHENIFVSGTILGMSKKDIENKYDDIVSFADIGDFLNTPLKNYSSGMLVRLGFSIAAHFNPEILLIDEVLSVGDENFREKSAGRIMKYLEDGGTAIFISHNLQSVRVISDRVGLLLHGKLTTVGQPDEVIQTYFESISGSYGGVEDEGASSKIRIDSVHILDDGGRPVSVVDYGQSVTVRLNYTAFEQLSRPYFFIQFYRGRQHVLTYNMMRLSGDWTVNKGNGFVDLHLPNLYLSPNKYDIICGIQRTSTEALGKKYYIMPRYAGTFEVTPASFVKQFKIVTDLAGLESLTPAYLPFSWKFSSTEIQQN